MVTWDGGRVSTSASVAVAGQLTGARLRDSYADSVRRLTLGVIQLKDDAVRMGPLELVRFGRPEVTRSAVDWPIEGGLLARGPGGRWRLEASGGQVQASLTGYRPALPRPLYALAHLQVHQLFTRLFLLRVRGRQPAPGNVAAPSDRARAAAVDAALCFTLAGLAGRRRVRRTLAISIAYHVTCWSLSGRTLGGLVMRQRVVAVDGSRLTPTQSLLRLALLPLSWILRRPVHDEVAGTTVITD
ncbi:MAG TPA: RDD family protein [Candidatus Dormibacteraeota bacterium]